MLGKPDASFVTAKSEHIHQIEITIIAFSKH